LEIVQICEEKRVEIAINAAAHEEEGLKDTYYGVGIGRKGWLEPGAIFTAMDFGEIKTFLDRRKPF
jgi:DNA polymerase (family 10)